ncbi:MAG: sulfatase-like hydrolase/transferase [Rubripirellula sp.]
MAHRLAVWFYSAWNTMHRGMSGSILGSSLMNGFSSRSIILCVLSLVLVVLGSVVRADTQPNVVVVFIDDMGWADFSCFGNADAETPAIDRLAREGISFEQFYVNSPICSPSRVAISTGQYPQRWRITSYLAHRQLNELRGLAQWLDPKAPMLARSLQQAGYATGHFGKWHMGGQRDVDEAPAITEYGFDASLTNFEGMGAKLLPLTKTGDGKVGKIWGDAVRLGEPVTWMQRSKITSGFIDAAIPFMENAKSANQPFYVNIWPDDVHSPFWPPAEEYNVAKSKGKRGLYLAVLEAMDRQFAKLFAYIRENPKLRDNTLVLVCSDNGCELGAGQAGPLKGYKTHLFEGGIRSPLVVWGPGLVAADAVGTRNTTSVFSAIDLTPSLLTLAHAKPPSGTIYDGEDVLDTLLGKSTAGRQTEIYFRRPPDRKNYYGFSQLPDLAVRQGAWKLLCDYDGSRSQLYNLIDDPGEEDNLAADKPEVVSKLTAKLLAWNNTMPQDNGLELGMQPEKKSRSSRKRYRLQQGDDLSGNSAPEYGGRSVTITTSFDSKGSDGVIVAQGGDKQGYALYIREGKLVLGVRDAWKLTEAVASEPIASGNTTVTATISINGKMELVVNGKVAATADATCVLAQAGDGLQVGDDKIKPVGKYTVTTFAGSISEVKLKFD